MVHFNTESAAITAVVADGGDLTAEAQGHAIVHSVLSNGDCELVPGQKQQMKTEKTGIKDFWGMVWFTYGMMLPASGLYLRKMLQKNTEGSAGRTAQPESRG
jgi:hypothetical protein